MSGLVLLTGATGFVGRQVLSALVEHGRRIRLVVRAEKSDHLSALENVESIIETPDLFAENIDWWINICKGVDIIIHVAWYAEPGEYLKSPKNLDCLSGTLQMAKAAAVAGVRRFVGVGTCFEYDLKKGKLSVVTPLRPNNTYAGSKAAAYLALSQWLPGQGLEFAWCRLFYLYGEGEDGRRLIPYLRRCLEAGEPAELTNGKQIRDFLDVREAGKAIALTALGLEQGAVNICSGIPISVRQLAEGIAREYGRPDLLRFGARLGSSIEPPCVVGIIGQKQI